MPIKFNPIRKARRLLEPGEGLYQRTVRSGAWVFALRISDQGFSLIRLIILARVLAPHDFGLMGVAMLAMATLSTFTATGFDAALIQKKEKTEDYLNAAWTVSVLRGLVLAGVLFFAAPYVAIFFDVPEAVTIVRVIGISVLLGGFANIGVVYFQKELEFGKQFFYQLSGTLADFVVAVSAALILRSVWALVFGLLASSIVRLIVSYLIHPYRPRFSLDLGKASELFAFGKWILGSTITEFFARQGDDVFLGKVLGVTTLGFYQMAFRFGNMPSAEIGLVARVTFPLYSKLQDNISLLKDTYLRILRLVAFVAMPLAAGLFMLSPYFTHIFLGDKWMPIVLVLRIFAISAMIEVMAGTSMALFRGVGKPNMAFKMMLAKVIAMAVIIYPLTMLWGMPGTALSVLISTCVPIPLWLFYAKEVISIRAIDYRGTLLPPLIGSATMFGVLFTLGRFIDQFQLNWFIFSVFIGVATYFGIIFLTHKTSGYAVFKDIRFILNSLKTEPIEK